MKINFKSFISLLLVAMMLLCSMPLQAIAANVSSLPDATVEVLEPITLAEDEYMVWGGSLPAGTTEVPLQAVMKFTANDSLEEARAGKYADWICDFYLTFNGMETDSVSGAGSYLAGNYGEYGWIVIPTDSIEVEKGKEYPVVTKYDPNLTYENICDYVEEFTAAIYVNPETLLDNPNMTVTLALKMTDPDDPYNTITIGKPAVYTAPELYGYSKPVAKVTVMDPITLISGNYKVWTDSLSTGDTDIPLQAMLNFEAVDSLKEAILGGYGDWICDFYLSFDNLEGGSMSGDGSYLAGAYGEEGAYANLGWIAIPTDGLTVVEGEEYPVVTSYDSNLTYENICDYVRNFTAALYINPETLKANPNMTVTLKLKMTNRQDENDFFYIGEPAVYTASELIAREKIEAEVTVKDPLTLESNTYDVYTGSLNKGTTDRPLQAVVHFKALDSKEEAANSFFANWICDFYLSLDGIKDPNGIYGKDCYLAGAYGEEGLYAYLGWIVIPVDEEVLFQEDEEYPVVTSYDPNLTYANICDYVREFTAAIYIAPEILIANPDFAVTLSLKVKDPANSDNVIVVGDPIVYTAEDLLAACDYVAINKNTNKLYDDVNLANTEAEKGETVALLTDVDVKTLAVYETLDLNGYTLKAKYVTSFGDIVDNSEDNGGLLKVSNKNFFIQPDNDQLPVNTEDGYKFVEVKNILGKYDATSSGDKKYGCMPIFEEFAHNLLLAGSNVSGVDIRVNVSWVNSKGENRSQDFSYTDIAFLSKYINSYNPDKGIYSKMFSLMLNNVTTDLTYQCQVVSDTGVVFVSDSCFVEAPTETTTLENITINTNAGATAASALVPSGTKLSGTVTVDSLKLTVSELENSGTNINLAENEDLRSVDVHINGISKDNTVPMIITLSEFASKGLNEGNIALYHVENGNTVKMTQVFTASDVDAHNEFYYDPATGDVVMALASFSEVAFIEDKEKAWKGNFDYSWYTNTVALTDGEAINEYTIANADQLAAFGAIVGGMDGQTQDSFAGKTVKLIADINLGDKEEDNNPDIIFYPIGYYNSEGTYERTNTAITSELRNFEGTFDGNGHTISNFYHNTWEMKGDHNWYTPEEQYYRDGMGLFGRVYGGTVKNLTVDNFSSDGEIATTGVIAAYADFGATFENIAITNCNPRVYNIGNGGIVGCVGWYTKGETDKKVTFKNITVDNSNKISALWGSYDVACGGIVGQYYPTSGQTSAGTPKNAGIHFENCHVSAIMDVYNDVCANYQYYAYRYTGMLIGSVRENVTIDGHVYPKMDGITAEKCTVHFGDWNDYYYCELVANSLASYTHDHQFSRLEQVTSIDTAKMEVTALDGKTAQIPTSGRVNYVVVNGDHATKNATCYHFVDGKVWNHDDAGTETVNDVEVLKEDKQHIYLEFNNLVTGYGWGVTTKGVGDLDGVAILDREVGNSYIKFNKADNAKDSYTTESSVTIGELFKAGEITDKKLLIVDDKVQVTVSPVGEDSTAGGKYTANTLDWTQGTLTFTGTGTAAITIQDYYFCTPTTITVNITERQPAEKFDVVMNNGDFLHRVGNSGTVVLDKLFKAKDDVSVGTVSVTVKALNGTAASGTYTPNSTWTNGTIQFYGTGVVKVTINDDDEYCTPTVLYLEVIDAVNATTATSATKNNVVLLNDCGFSSLEVSGGYALYGNGFTMTCASDSVAVDRNYGFISLTNGTLDNVKIITPNFSHSILFDSNKTEGGNPSSTDNGRTRYNNIRSAVVMTGNSTIVNSFVSGGRAAVYVANGNANIKNSTIKGGAAANVHVERIAAVTLEDVTLIQKPFKANVNDKTKTIMGLSVVTLCDSDGLGGTIVLKGKLHQYAWARESYKQYVPEKGQSLVSSVLNNRDFVHEIAFDDGVTAKAVNLGIAFIPDGLTSSNANSFNDSRNDQEKQTFVYETVGVSTANVVTYKNTNGTNEAVKVEPMYSSNGQMNVMPKFIFTDTNENRVFETVYDQNAGWTSILKVDVDAGNYSFSFDKLLVQKYGINLNYTVTTDDGTTVDKNTPIVLNESKSLNYKLSISDNLIYDNLGDLTGKQESKSYMFVIQSTKTSISGPEWKTKPTPNTKIVKYIKSGNDWTLAIPVLTGAEITYWSAKSNDYVALDLTELTPTETGKQANGGKDWTVKVDGEYTLTISSTVFKTNYDGMPVVYEENGTKTLYYTVNNKNGCLGSGTTSRTIIFTYAFTDSNNNSLKDNTVTWNVNISDINGNGSINYDTFVGNSSGGSGNCVTPDTLITLADGTQKRVDEITYNDQLLVWNFFTGEYSAIPSALIVNHGYDNWTVIELSFSDGTSVKAITAHAFFDKNTNTWELINATNAKEYIGHSFVKASGDSYSTVKLVSVDVYEEYTESYSLVSAVHYNFITNDMFSLTNSVNGMLSGLVVGDDMTYDKTTLENDIAKYGLYTYADFENYITFEQYQAFNGDYLKISVGKGKIKFTDILALIDSYLKN